jgi:hypothetical protein
LPIVVENEEKERLKQIAEGHTVDYVDGEQGEILVNLRITAWVKPKSLTLLEFLKNQHCVQVFKLCFIKRDVRKN